MTRGGSRDELAEMLESGADRRDDAPEGIAIFLRDIRGYARQPPPTPRADLAYVLQLGSVDRAGARRRVIGLGHRPARRLHRGVIAASFVAASVATTGGLAAADALPAPIQRTVSHLVGHVGIDIPAPSSANPHPGPVVGRGAPKTPATTTSGTQAAVGTGPASSGVGHGASPVVTAPGSVTIPGSVTVPNVSAPITVPPSIAGVSVPTTFPRLP